MKSFRIVVALVLAAGLVLAFAGVAHAADYGYVYGQATQIPVIAITLGGSGTSDLDPLYYTGHGGDTAWEYNGDWLTVYNDGECDVDLYISPSEAPNDGLDTWSFGGSSGVDTAVWEFDNADNTGYVAVPSGGDSYLGFLGVDDTTYLDSRFTFPSNFTSENTYHMSAMITAYED